MKKSLALLITVLCLASACSSAAPPAPGESQAPVQEASVIVLDEPQAETEPEAEIENLWKDTYYAFGAWGQSIFVVPQLDLVTVIASHSPENSYAPRPNFTDYVLAAYRG